MIIEVKVKTNSKESKVVMKDNIYYAYTKSPAREDKANTEVIDLLAEYFDISKSNVRIKRGLRGKNKIIQIH